MRATCEQRTVSLPHFEYRNHTSQVTPHGSVWKYRVRFFKGIYGCCFPHSEMLHLLLFMPACELWESSDQVESQQLYLCGCEPVPWRGMQWYSNVWGPPTGLSAKQIVSEEEGSCERAPTKWKANNKTPVVMSLCLEGVCSGAVFLGGTSYRPVHRAVSGYICDGLWESPTCARATAHTMYTAWHFVYWLMMDSLFESVWQYHCLCLKD